MKSEIASIVSRELSLPQRGVEAVISMLEEGATVPFISRYRKEATGHLDEVQVRSIEVTLRKVTEMEERRRWVEDALRDGGHLTPELWSKLSAARSLTEIEDLYAPYKPKKRTRASMAREKGLEPLARKIMTGYLPAGESQENISGASDIIAEWASESPRLRNITRNTISRHGLLSSKPVKGMEETLETSPLAQYGNFTQRVSRMASHQYLALKRAEREGLIKLNYQIDTAKTPLEETLAEAFLPKRTTADTERVIRAAVSDATKRLLRPSIENETSAGLKEKADETAISIFADNLRQLLLAPPVRGRRILAIDPGYRTGCKVVALDANGTLLDDAVIYPTAPRLDTAGAARILERMMRTHQLDAVAIGNGTASRETERFVKQAGILPSEDVYVVSEDGASVYSASEAGREEFPDKDVTVRGAVSIGRRLIDPLAELVKIDPKSIGVGQYQHDVDQNSLKDALDYTVMSCVNSVGVDLNTASAALLSYVSGIGPALAANIVKHRTANGPFRSRQELKKVARLGAKAFELCAGFLRVADGDEPLDNTGIHPESYPLTRTMAGSIGKDVKDVIRNPSLLSQINISRLAEEGKGGLATMTDILKELEKPGRDPRLDNASADFRPSVESFDQLRPGMKVNGRICNITAFGAFVDLGIKENGLIHISRLANRRVGSVSEVVSLGQQVEATVLEIDTAKKRISLSLV